MQKQKHYSGFRPGFGLLAAAAIYIAFMTSVVAYAFRQHQILYHPRNLQESAEAVLIDTTALQDPPADSLQKMLESDSEIIDHSRIPGENR